MNYFQCSATHYYKPLWIVWWHIGIEMARKQGLVLFMTHDEMWFAKRD